MQAAIPPKMLVSSHQTIAYLLISSCWNIGVDTWEQFTCTVTAVAAQQMKQNKYPALANSCTQTRAIPTLTDCSVAKNT